ncbi:MAG: alpha/beta hydrolase [Alphaproteobacteria bacterium]
MQAQFIDVNGVRTRLLRSGAEGVAVLLAHGLGVSADMWVRIIDELALRYQVVAPDMLGHGFTAWAPDLALHPEAYLGDHLAEVMGHLGHQDYFVVGSSLGGIVAAHLFRRHGAKVRGLVLIGTDAMFGPTRSLDPSVLTQAARNAGKAFDDPTWENCLRRLQNICVVPDTPLDDVALVQMTIYAQPDRHAAYQELCGQLIRSIENGSAALAPEEIGVPTLIVCGRQDIRARIELIRDNYRRIPGARLVELDPCGHLPHLEAPAALLRVLREFLDGHVAAMPGG